MENNPCRIFTEADLRTLLNGMITPRGFQASGNEKFRAAVFGRDSIWIARFLIDSPYIVHLAIKTIAATQGVATVARREEESGKIAHEYRVRTEPGTSIQVYDWMAGTFGEISEGVLVVYPSLDATPLWLILLGEYSTRYGRNILDENVRLVSGEVRTVIQVAVAALDWIFTKMQASRLGFLEAPRHNTSAGSHPYHVMRDGKTGYKFENGKEPNANDPIAYLEVQGYTFDALMHAERLLGGGEYQRAALKLRQAIFEHFWNREGHLAAALDTDPATGERRPITTASTVQLEVLGTSIFDDLGAKNRRAYIEDILKSVYQNDFRTLAGLRSFPTKYDQHWNEGYGYDGSRAVWPILTHLVARGMRRQGYHALAYDLAARMVNAVNIAGTPREVFFADLDGRIIYDPKGVYGGGEKVKITTVGEDVQTWTIAACIEAIRNMLVEAPHPSLFEEEQLQGSFAFVRDLASCQEAFERRYRVTPLISKPTSFL